MEDRKQREAARRFAGTWKGKGYEKGQSQPFWLQLLREVYGVEQPEQFISFEEQVPMYSTKYIDGYIEKAQAMIEHKSSHIDLDKPEPQSDGKKLTPYQQAKRYWDELPRLKDSLKFYGSPVPCGLERAFAGNRVP